MSGQGQAGELSDLCVHLLDETTLESPLASLTQLSVSLRSVVAVICQRSEGGQGGGGRSDILIARESIAKLANAMLSQDAQILPVPLYCEVINELLPILDYAVTSSDPTIMSFTWDIITRICVRAQSVPLNVLKTLFSSFCGHSQIAAATGKRPKKFFALAKYHWNLLLEILKNWSIHSELSEDICDVFSSMLQMTCFLLFKSGIQSLQESSVLYQDLKKSIASALALAKSPQNKRVFLNKLLFPSTQLSDFYSSCSLLSLCIVLDCCEEIPVQSSLLESWTSLYNPLLFLDTLDAEREIDLHIGDISIIQDELVKQIAVFCLSLPSDLCSLSWLWLLKTIMRMESVHGRMILLEAITIIAQDCDHSRYLDPISNILQRHWTNDNRAVSLISASKNISIENDHALENSLREVYTEHPALSGICCLLWDFFVVALDSDEHTADAFCSFALPMKRLSETVGVISEDQRQCVSDAAVILLDGAFQVGSTPNIESKFFEYPALQVHIGASSIG